MTSRDNANTDIIMSLLCPAIEWLLWRKWKLKILRMGSKQTMEEPRNTSVYCLRASVLRYWYSHCSFFIALVHIWEQFMQCFYGQARRHMSELSDKFGVECRRGMLRNVINESRQKRGLYIVSCCQCFGLFEHHVRLLLVCFVCVCCHLSHLTNKVS